MNNAAISELLRASFGAAIAAADPLHMLAAFLPNVTEIKSYRKTLVVGAGKAAASMALAVERAWPIDCALEGLVVTRYQHGAPTSRIRVLEAGHPVPDAEGELAAREIFERAQSLTEDDLLLVLVSGGGSSLLSLPVDSVPMADLKLTTQQLLRAGTPIEEMNIVRKHLSQIQGGRLAQATRAKVIGLVISDVAGDELSAIASGPTAPDPSTYAQALSVLKRWNIQAPATVLAHLESGVSGAVSETPKLDNEIGRRIFARVTNHMLATAHQSLEAGARVLRNAGFQTVILGDTITGEARDVAQVMAALTREVLHYEQPFKAPVALISGGECTVTVRGKGRGGRCAEFLLALTHSLGDQARVAAIAADTDGIDGSENNAGALLLPDSNARAIKAGLVAREYLDRNDGYAYFEALGDLVITGPTLTNVNDYRVVLIL
jgi:glycerate 2-kinase